MLTYIALSIGGFVLACNVSLVLLIAVDFARHPLPRPRPEVSSPEPLS